MKENAIYEIKYNVRWSGDASVTYGEKIAKKSLLSVWPLFLNKIKLRKYIFLPPGNIERFHDRQ